MELEEVSGLSFRSKDRAAKKKNAEAQLYNARLLQDQKRIRKWTWYPVQTHVAVRSFSVVSTVTELNRPS